MSGNAAYRPATGYEKRRHFLGPAKSPIWIGQKADVPKLLTETFWRLFEAWRYFRIGAGWPEPGTWADQGSVVAEAVLKFEEYYRVYFSHENALIESQNQLARLLAGRR